MIYGLPKIHKADIPLRPIVACIDSPSYTFSKCISSIISPLAGQSDSYVKDSKDFSESIKVVNILEDDVLVSFYVKSSSQMYQLMRRQK